MVDLVENHDGGPLVSPGRDVDAQNRAIRPIYMGLYAGSNMLGSGLE